MRIVRQPRASTETEPSEAEALLSIALIVLAAFALGWLWFGNSGEFVRCVLAYLAGRAH